MGIKRGDDAQDHTPRADAGAGTKTAPPPEGKQDGKNYETRTDEGEAVEVDDLSSANDEGAN